MDEEKGIGIDFHKNGIDFHKNGIDFHKCGQPDEQPEQ